MVVDGASSENILSASFGHDICLSVLALRIADHPLLKLSHGYVHISHFENKKKRRLRNHAR